MDNNSVEKLYLNYKDQIYNFILRLINDPEIAMDVTQQTFLNVMCDSKLSKLTRAQILQVSRELLYQETSFINKFPIDRYDENINYNINNDQFNAIPISSALKKLRYNINLSLTAMSIRTRELMILYFIENISIVDIAEITKRSIVDVKVNLFDARVGFEKTLINYMKGKVMTSDTECRVYSEIVNSNHDSIFSDRVLKTINQHISICIICLNSREQLKRTGVLLNLIPNFKAPSILDDAIAKVLNISF